MLFSGIATSNSSFAVGDSEYLFLLNADFESNANLIHELSPREYFPLGVGIRKNSQQHLVPFCVAMSSNSKGCARIQYFEVTRGQYVDSDRAVDSQAGAPTNRVTGAESPFHGVAVGGRMSGYVYSGGGFESAKNDFLQSFTLPEKVRVINLFTDYSIFGNDLGMGGEIVLAAASGAIFGVITGDNLGRVGRGALIGAAIPVTVYSLIFGKALLRRSRAEKQVLRSQRRIERSFVLSKSMSENWLLIKGLKVSSKTYDAFVEFLNHSAQK